MRTDQAVLKTTQNHMPTPAVMVVMTLSFRTGQQLTIYLLTNENSKDGLSSFQENSHCICCQYTVTVLKALTREIQSNIVIL